MSEYHPTSYQEDSSPGQAPGAASSYGDEGAYQAFEELAYGDQSTYQAFEEVAYGDQGSPQEPVFGDQGTYAEPTYGDQGTYEEPVYGDQGSYEEQTYGDQGSYAEPTYGDQGTYAEPVYGDQGSYQEPVYGDQGAYGDEVAYGDQGAYGEETAYGDGGAYGEQGAYSEEAYGDEAYEEATSYDDTYEADDAYDEAPEAPVSKKRRKTGPRSKRPLILAGAGLAVMAAMGAAGYFLLLAPGAGQGGFDPMAIVRMIPLPSFGGESDETLAAGQANALAVKRAVDGFAEANGRLPTAASEINDYLHTSGWNLVNPYNPDEPLSVELAEVPSAPGAVAVNVHGQSYDIQVGDRAGAPLAQDGQPIMESGRLGASTASRPIAERPSAARPAAKPATTPPPQVAKAPTSPPRAARPPESTPERRPAAVPRLAPRPLGEAPTVPPVVVPKHDAVSPAARMRRNQEFDHWRSVGISMLYTQRTTEAIVAFKKALAIRPGDETTLRYLQAIQGALDEHTKAERKKYEEQARFKVRQDTPPLPPLPGQEAQRQDDEAKRMLDELRSQRAPALAPPNAND